MCQLKAKEQTKLMQGRLHTEEQRSDHTVRFSVKLLTVSLKHVLDS